MTPCPKRQRLNDSTIKHRGSNCNDNNDQNIIIKKEQITNDVNDAIEAVMNKKSQQQQQQNLLELFNNGNNKSNPINLTNFYNIKINIFLYDWHG